MDKTLETLFRLVELRSQLVGSSNSRVQPGELTGKNKEAVLKLDELILTCVNAIEIEKE